MQEKITALRADCTQEIEQCTTSLQLQEVKVKYMGKSGLITALLKGMKDVAPEDRPKVGSMVNQLRNELESVLENKTAEIAEMELQHKLKSEKVEKATLLVYPHLPCFICEGSIFRMLPLIFL